MIRISRHLLLSACIVLIVGCCGTGGEPANSSFLEKENPVLDSLLVAKGVPARVKEAEQDRPTDTWKEGGTSRPGRLNVSRDERMSALARELLGSLKPRLAQLSAENLILSLKTTRYGDSEPFSGVAYYVYRDGNSMIVQELTRRPKSQLKFLRSFQKSPRAVFSGEGGGYYTVGQLVTINLLNRQ